MSRKDYRLIAGVIRSMDFQCPADRVDMAESMADALATSNSRFNRSTFLAACGV